MKFLLAFARDREKMYDASEEEMKQAMEAWNAFNKEAIDAGVLIANEALELPEEAKTVRVSAGRPSRHRRSVHRDQGAARRLLPDRLRQPRRGDWLGEEGADRRRGRGPAGEGPL